MSCSPQGMHACTGPPPTSLIYSAPVGGEGKKAPTITGQSTVPKMPRAQVRQPPHDHANIL